VPVAWVARVPNVLVVSANAPSKTFKEFIDRARANPGRLTYSSGGNGSAAHITFESLKLRAKIFMLHIPYRGTAPSVTDLIAGQVDATFTGSPAVLPHVKSGRLRALAVSSPQRITALPEVPTVAESGYPGFEADQWYGIVAPAGTPAERVARLNAEINKALALPDVAQQLVAEGATPMPGTPQAFGDLIAREIDELLERLRRRVCAHHQHVRHPRHPGHGHEALQRVVRKLRVDRRVHGEGTDVAHQHRIAVGLGLGGFAGTERTTGARLVVDDDVLPERQLQLGGERARQDVGAAAGRERHDDAQHPPRLREAPARPRQRRQRGREQQLPAMAFRGRGHRLSYWPQGGCGPGLGGPL